MRYLTIFLLSSLFVLNNGYLIESDADQIIRESFSLKRNILSDNQNITNSSFPIQTSAPEPDYGVYINSIVPKIGVGGMKIRVYSDFLVNNEVYFLDFCNDTTTLICNDVCQYLELVLPVKNQGSCNVNLGNNSINFTYTVATPKIEIKLSIDINLNNVTEVNIFKNNFKHSLVQSLSSVNEIDQIYVCDTCISEVSNRRILNIQVKIIFQIVANQPINQNIENWKSAITTETVDASNTIVYNLAQLQNKNITFMGFILNNFTNTSNNSVTIFNNYTKPNTDKDGFGNAWEIALISIASYLFIAFIIKYYLDYRNKRRIIKQQEFMKENSDSSNQNIKEINDDDIVVIEI